MSKTETAARRWQTKMGRKTFATIGTQKNHGPGTTASAIANREYRESLRIKSAE